MKWMPIYIPPDWFQSNLFYLFVGTVLVLIWRLTVSAYVLRPSLGSCRVHVTCLGELDTVSEVLGTGVVVL